MTKHNRDSDLIQIKDETYMNKQENNYEEFDTVEQKQDPINILSLIALLALCAFTFVCTCSIAQDEYLRNQKVNLKIARDQENQPTNSINSKKQPADFKFDVLRNVFIPIESSTDSSNDISNTSQSNKISPSTTIGNSFGFVVNTNTNNLEDDDYEPEDEKQYNQYIKLLNGEVVDEIPNLQSQSGSNYANTIIDEYEGEERKQYADDIKKMYAYDESKENGGYNLKNERDSVKYSDDLMKISNEQDGGIKDQYDNLRSDNQITSNNDDLNHENQNSNKQLEYVKNKYDIDINDYNSDVKPILKYEYMPGIDDEDEDDSVDINLMKSLQDINDDDNQNYDQQQGEDKGEVEFTKLMDSLQDFDNENQWLADNANTQPNLQMGLDKDKIMSFEEFKQFRYGKDREENGGRNRINNLYGYGEKGGVDVFDRGVRRDSYNGYFEDDEDDNDLIRDDDDFEDDWMKQNSNGRYIQRQN